MRTERTDKLAALLVGFLPRTANPTSRGSRSYPDKQHPKRIPKRERPKCQAACRSKGGAPCEAPVVPGKNRCRMHGGLSTGPRTPEGRAKIAESNTRRRVERWERIRALLRERGVE
ncbi:MAG TPA: HGGxSTG domain-containing protein [Chthonomonadaceae bacterium]|nr:HGGxSTG domain-containing protein [Chthonomonadaceae bacterium]